LLPSRLAEQSVHPAHLLHVHFFCQSFSFVAHHDLHCGAAVGDGVGTGVGAAVMPSHEQHTSPTAPSSQLSHMKAPPCKTHSLLWTSVSQAVGEGVGESVGGVGTGVGGVGAIVGGVGAIVGGDVTSTHCE